MELAFLWKKFVSHPTIESAVTQHRAEVARMERKTPYGIPYEPDIWGAGWGIQRFGREQYFFHKAFPEIFPRTFVLRALNFILGCHPGPNTSSFISGVGARSLTTAYGLNRADWSYIPGGSGSGTALIRPDFHCSIERRRSFRARTLG